MPSACDAIIDTYMVEHLHEILGGKPWPTLTPTQCRHCSDGFSFLTPVGLHYYLPAYMTAEIVDPEEADVVADSLIRLFQGVHWFRDGLVRFWQLVTPMQLAVIGKWIDHYETKFRFHDGTKTEVETARNWVARVADSTSRPHNGG
ncbi:MAG: DUF6714 family protein [Planctomycetaceae bacterium]